MKISTAIVVAAVILASALVVCAWMSAQGEIVSAYTTAHAEFGTDREKGCPVPEPSSFSPIIGIDW